MASEHNAALVFINWNSAALTIAAARSAWATTDRRLKLQIVVVDNRSDDDSVAVLRRDLSQAELVEMPGNLGFAKAVNAGLGRVSAPYAFILNSDIEFRNDAITILIQALEADDAAVLACPKLVRPDGSVQAAAVPEPRLLWELTNRSLARHLLRVPGDRTSVVPGVVGPCMALKTRQLAAVGALDERFFFFFEETDWCKRIRDSGRHVLFVPAAEVMHLQGESADRRPVRARVQFYSSRYRFFRKHSSLAGVALLFVGLFARLTLNLLLQSLLVLVSLGRRRYRDKLAVYAVLWAWHALGCRPRWGFE